MGRSLFSLTYTAPEPSVRTAPEPKVDLCERWSSWSHFDPDSEDFFQDAEYEAFVDPAQLERERAEIAAMAAAEGSTSDSSDSSDASDSDRGSPMAVGSDDPADLIAGATRRAQWAAIVDARMEVDAEWRPTTDRATSPMVYTTSPVYVSDMPALIPVDQSGNLPFIPPAVFRAPTPTRVIDDETDSPSASPRSATLRRTFNITPINVSRVQVEPLTRSPSPETPGSPVTPPPHTPAAYRQHAQMTPSPPPSVTPRFYSWQNHPLPAIPTSPTRVRGVREGPLTNPRARMSFTRIDTPARVRVPNTVL